MPSKPIASFTDFAARVLIGLAIMLFIAALVPPIRADVIDSSLKVRLNFDSAPVGDVIADTSPAGGHLGSNNSATWVANEAGRDGVMSFDGTVPSQITLAPPADLNSSV